LSKHGSSAKAIMYAFLANFGIFAAKGIAALYTGSGSMLAESIHSLADCTNQVLLFLGLKRSEKPATYKHPLGYGKIIYFWSFIVAVLLFSMGGLFSIYEGVHKLSHPEELNRVWIALLVLGVSIILESLSLFGALREIKIIKKGKSLREWIKTTVRAELLVVFGEDAAAILGLTVAFVFLLLAFITGNPLYDSLGSISIGGILVLISLFLIVRLKSLLIGRSASEELQALIRKEIESDENIVEIFNIITMQMGPDVMLAAKIRLKSGLDIESSCSIINRIEANIKKYHEEVEWIFIEPDIEC
jgi:cation diffusion facilitator family transporter